MSWIRDIVERGVHDNKKTHKIFLIDASSNPLSDAKKLYFRNHGIVHIPILNSNCISFLEKETKRKIRDHKSRREILIHFLEYLNPEDYINQIEIALHTLRKEEYNNFWRTFKHATPFVQKDQPIQSYHKDQIQDFSNRNRIQPIQFDDRKRAFLADANKEYIELKDDHSKKIFLKKVALAIEDLLVPIDIVVENYKPIAIEGTQFKETSERFNLINLKRVIWSQPYIRLELMHFNDKLLQQEAKYYSILQLAFNFNFDKLRDELSKWKPSGHWVMKKAGLLTIFSVNETVDLLKESLQTSSQEELYRQWLLMFYERTLNWGLDTKKTLQYIRNLEGNGLEKFEANFDHLVDKFLKIKKNIEPHGSYFTNNQNVFTANNEFDSFRLLGLLIEMGLPLSVPRGHYYSVKEIYPVLSNISDYTPMPVLFYLLQYGDDKAIKKLGQHYAYSDKLFKQLPRISKTLLTSYLLQDTPASYKKAILLFQSQLFVSISPSVWESKFMIIWNSRKKANTLFIGKRLNDESFLENGLQFVEQKSSILSILKECLINSSGSCLEISITYLYNLAKNKTFNQYTKKNVSHAIHQKIDYLIKNILPNDLNLLYVFTNIKNILSKKQQTNISQQLSKIDLTRITNERLWNLIVYFYDDSKVHRKRIKTNIINSKLLWYSGIQENNKTIQFGNGSFISLYSITSGKDRKYGLQWTENEIISIYEKLMFELKRIIAVHNPDRDLPFSQFDQILTEMIFFLNFHQNILKKINHSKRQKQAA